MAVARFLRVAFWVLFVFMGVILAGGLLDEVAGALAPEPKPAPVSRVRR